MRNVRPGLTLFSSALLAASMLSACGGTSGGGSGGNDDVRTGGGGDDVAVIPIDPGADVGAGVADDATVANDDVSGADATPTDTTTGGIDTVNVAEDTSPPVVGVGEIAVDPEQYTFSYVSPLPEPLIRQISIFNVGTASLTITGVALLPGASPDFTLSAIPPLPKVLQPGDSTLGLIVFKEIAGGTATLRVTSTDPARPTVDVPLESFLKADLNGPEPCVGLKPTALNFGGVERGDTKTLQAVLSNCSNEAPLTLKNIERGTTFFFALTQEIQVTPMPAFPTIIPPGGSLPIDITYTPDLAGPDTGFFLIETDDPAEPKVKLDVSGFGKEPPPEEIGLTIKLSWNSDLCDVDSHFIEPGGTFFDCQTDCYFGNPSPDWAVQGDWKDNPYLDVDDVDGYGPEHTNITEPKPGKYRFVVHYYSDSYEGSGSTDTEATVEVYSYGVLLQTFGPVYLDKTNRNWDVFDIEWPSKQITPLGATYITSASGGFCFPGFP
jgi:hypothetical protein